MDEQNRKYFEQWKERLEALRHINENDIALLCFSLGGTHFGIDARAVFGIGRPDTYATIPYVKSEGILGVIAVQGRLEPVIDLAALLHVTPETYTRRIIIDGKETKPSFDVDYIFDCIRVDAKKIEVRAEAPFCSGFLAEKKLMILDETFFVSFAQRALTQLQE